MARPSARLGVPDSESDDEILLVAPPPAPTASATATVNTCSGDPGHASTAPKRSRVASPSAPPKPKRKRTSCAARPDRSPSRSTSDSAPTPAAVKAPLLPPTSAKRQHMRWTDDTATGGTIASISYSADSDLETFAHSQPLRRPPPPPSPPVTTKPPVRSLAAAAIVTSPSVQKENQRKRKRKTMSPPSSSTSTTATPSTTQRKRARSPSFELEIINYRSKPNSRPRSAVPPQSETSSAPAPGPASPPRSGLALAPGPVPGPASALIAGQVPDATPSLSTVAVHAPTRSTVSPDEPDDILAEPRASLSSSSSVKVWSSPLRDHLEAADAIVRPFDLVFGANGRSASTALEWPTVASTLARPSRAASGRVRPSEKAPDHLPTLAPLALLPFPSKPASHPLNSLRLKPNPLEPPPPLPVRFLRNNDFEPTKGLGGWVLPYSAAAAAAAAAAMGGKGKGRGSRGSSRESTPARQVRNDPGPDSSRSSRAPTPTSSASTYPALAPARAAPISRAPLSFAEWAHRRYGFLDPGEMSRYKIDGSTLGIDPDWLSYEWDEDELWDAFEDRYGARERNRVARGDESDACNDEDAEDAEGGDSEGSEYDEVTMNDHVRVPKTRPIPPRPRMAFTAVTTGHKADDDESSSMVEVATSIAGTEVLARLCHLASTTEGARDPSTRLTALSQLGFVGQSAVRQVPWRWRSLEEGKGRARGGTGLGGAPSEKGARWATRNPFMRGTKAEETGRGARRAAAVKVTEGLHAASPRGTGPTASQRHRAEAAAAAAAAASASSSRASSVGIASLGLPTTGLLAATNAEKAPVAVAVAVAAAMNALYGLSDDDHDDDDDDDASTDLTGLVARKEVSPSGVGAGLAPAAGQVPHLGSSLLDGGAGRRPPPHLSRPSLVPPARHAADLSSAASPSSSSTPALGQTSERAVVQLPPSVHGGPAGMPTPPPSGRDDFVGDQAAPHPRGADDAELHAFASDWHRSGTQKPPTEVCSPVARGSSIPVPQPRSASPPASSSEQAAESEASRSGSSSRSRSSEDDRDPNGVEDKDGDGGNDTHDEDGGSTSASSSDPEAGPVIAARLLARPSTRPTAGPSPRASTLPVAGPKAPLLPTPPPKPPTVSKASTPTGMVRCTHPGCPSPFYRPDKPSLVTNHARNFHTAAVSIPFRDPVRTYYLARDPEGGGVLQCPFCPFWSMNAASMKQHPYRRACPGPPA
ncbi:hypothetical protein JCM3774_000379 [Rhodotorula dairenensis]